MLTRPFKGVIAARRSCRCMRTAPSIGRRSSVTWIGCRTATGRHRHEHGRLRGDRARRTRAGGGDPRLPERDRRPHALPVRHRGRLDQGGSGQGEPLCRNGRRRLSDFPALPDLLRLARAGGNDLPLPQGDRRGRRQADHLLPVPEGLGADYTPAILKRVAEIPEVVAIKESSFDVAQTLSTIATAATLDRPIGVLTGSDTFIFAMTMGCDGALIGFAGTFTRELVAMNDGVQAAISPRPATSGGGSGRSPAIAGVRRSGTSGPG